MTKMATKSKKEAPDTWWLSSQTRSIPKLNITSLHSICLKSHLYHAASLDGLLVPEEAEGGEEGAEDDADQGGCDGEHHLEEDA